MRNDSDCFLDRSTSQFNVYAANAASQHGTFVQSGTYAICLGFCNTQGPGHAGFLTWVRVYAPTFKIHGELVLFKSEPFRKYSFLEHSVLVLMQETVKANPMNGNCTST
jgi:hypothetical protein